MLTIRTLFSLARQKPEYYLNRDVIFEITKYLVENTNYRDLIYLIFDNKDKYQTKDKLINLLVKAGFCDNFIYLIVNILVFTFYQRSEQSICIKT